MSEENRQKFIALLKKYRPIDTLSDGAVSELATQISVTKQPANTMLFKREQANHHHFYLLAGKVDLVDEKFNITTISSQQDEAFNPLDNSDPHTVSAITKTQARILKVSKDRLDLVLTWDQAGNYMVADLNPGVDQAELDRDWMSSLLGSRLFQQIPPTNLQELFVKFTEVPVKKGHRVITEGDQGDTFYVIQKGAAQVLRTLESQEQKVLATLSPGEYFGEEALIGNTVRNASVEMITDGIVMQLGKEDFKTLLEEPVVQYIKEPDLKQWDIKNKKFIRLDVRLPVEISPQDRETRTLIPLSELRNKLDTLDQEVTYAICPEAGRRAVLGAYLLNESGYDAVVIKAPRSK